MSTATEVEVRFTLAISEGILQHKGAAEQKAKTAYVLELLRQGDISAGRAAKLLDISRWRISDLMSEAGICPFDDSLIAETLASGGGVGSAASNRCFCHSA